ncbi:MAG: PspA/IM30 family protein [Pseudomonadales bacterium]|jgi:phage shock protein A
MNESLLSRIGRIVSASANSLVDTVEGSAPELVMEQAIRELDEAVGEVRHELGRQEASKHLTSKQLIKENEQHEQLSEQIQVALQQQRDDLAEAAVARQMDIEAQVPVLDKTLEDQKERIVELNQYISALQAKKREMEQDLADYRESQLAAIGATVGSAQHEPSQQVDKAESAFNRAMSKASGHSSRQSSADERKLAELDELARRNRVQERLERLKAENRDKA